MVSANSTQAGGCSAQALASRRLRSERREVSSSLRVGAAPVKRDQWLRKTGAAPTRSELETSLRSERSRLLARACALHPPACVEFAETMLTKSDHAWRKKIPEAMALSGNEPLRQALSALLRMPPERYSDAQWQVLQSLIELLPLAAAQLRVVF